jgi:hypothetical protein
MPLLPRFRTDASVHPAGVWFIFLVTFLPTALTARAQTPFFTSAAGEESAQSASEVIPPGIAPSEPPLFVPYPGAAYTAGISKGSATVGVRLDEQGKAIDFLLVTYTERYFGEALLQRARSLAFTPLRVKGVGIPSRYLLSHVFYPDPNVPVVVNVSDALSRKFSATHGEAPLLHRAHQQSELDEPLEFVRVAKPLLPAGYTPKTRDPVGVSVSLYIDESGAVRLPSVDVTPSPLLVQNALNALEQWKFKPPLIRGAPVLVRARYFLNFETEP